MFNITVQGRAEWKTVDQELTIGNLRRAKRDFYPNANECFIEISHGHESVERAFNLAGFVPAGCATFVRRKHPDCFGMVEQFVIYVPDPPALRIAAESAENIDEIRRMASAGSPKDGY